MDERNDDPTAIDPPRALDLNRFQFNFRVGIAAQVAARYGAPAFAERRKRLDEACSRFWSDLEQRYAELWVAACEGRIADDGREVRQSLLTADGRDPMGARQHRRALFAADIQVEEAARQPFNRAWRRHVEGCGLAELARHHEEFVRFFPVEANLPSDPETGTFLWRGRPWQPPVAPTLADVLERFPLR